MNRKQKLLAIALALAALGSLALVSRGQANPANPAGSAGPRPALTVSVVKPASSDLPLRLAANGNVAAWQEAAVGAEVGGLRLAEVHAEVGDQVKKGQVLAVFAQDIPAAELAQARAAFAEAEATLDDAKTTAARARGIQSSGALSPLQLAQYQTAEATAQARADGARATLALQELRFAHTRVLAPDEGIISARSPAAAVGTVVPAGQELFRLIRRQRLEWRAEVTAAELESLKPGLSVRVTPPGGSAATGTVRSVAPAVDPQTRNALVYVDLPAAAGAGKNAPFKAGMFARGEFELGKSRGLTLPQEAVVLRDGNSYVFRVKPDNRVAQTKVQVGRRVGDRVEILTGLDAAASVAGPGAGFLNDGDLVKVVAAPTAPSAKPQ